jgi:L-iditol 2-dehydrogenase
MRAQVFHGPGDLRLEELPDPEPGAGEAVLRVEAALTCGTDVKVRRRGHPVMIPRVPTPFGHELAGVAVAVGRGVRGLREGDRVAVANSAPCGACGPCRAGRANLCEDLLFVNGAYAERILLPPRLVERNTVAIGAALPAARAAMAEPLACALHGIARGRVEAGMAVVIIGHGPLGWLLAMATRQVGARPIVVGRPGWRLDRARAAGLGELVTADPVPAATVESIRGLTGGRGAEVAIDATGRPEVWEQAIACTARGGTVVLFGGCAPGTTVAVDTRRAHYEELTLVGAFHHTPDLIRQALDLLAAGAVDADALITGAVGLAGVPAALDAMAEGRALKVQVDPARP